MFDPFEMQKKMMQEWEKNMGEYIEKTMRDPQFMKMMASNLETTLDFQNMLKPHIKTVLKGLSIPTDESLMELYRSVHNMETRLLDLEERLEDIEDSLKAKSAKECNETNDSAGKDKPCSQNRKTSGKCKK